MKFNKNIIVFIVAMLFILAGFTMEYYDTLKYELLSFVAQNVDAAEDVTALIDRIDDMSTDKLRYHSDMMNLDSAKQRLLQTRVIQKSETSMIVRTECDSLVELQTELFSEDEMAAVGDKVVQLQAHAQKNGAEFLYVIAPRKTNAIAVPENVVDFSNENVAALVREMEKRQVNTLNLCEILKTEGRLDESLFFKTDHHWKPEVGFWATGEICRELKESYGFEYDTKYTDISNYNVTVYKDAFLGSYGKKVGLYYVSGGAEDISLITPKFETNLTESRPYANIERTGSFHETLLYMEHIEKVDYFGKNPYAVYSGGDFRLQIIKNNANPKGEKILLIRDSFACVVAPFIALNAGEVHIVDVRDFIPSEALSVDEYIEKVQPDYVIVLYLGAGTPQDITDRYEFNLS